MTSAGFKPATSTAVMWCTIQLCYEAEIRAAKIVVILKIKDKVCLKDYFLFKIVMPANKYALLRYRIIDRSIRNKQRPFPSKEDLRRACEEALYGSDGEHISMSTIDKDIWAMRNEGELGFYAPIKFSKDNAGYYYQDSNYTISELPLNEDDLNAIKTAAETLFQFKDIPLFKQFDTAIEKILDRMKISAFDDHKTDHDVLQFERGSDYKGSEFLGMLFSASKEDQVVSFQYKKFNSNQSQLIILQPYLLKEYRSRWYVIGLDESKDALRTYSLDRLSDIALKGRTFKRSESFSTASFFKHALGITVTDDEHQKVRLKFSEKLSPYIISQPVHSSQQILNNVEGGVIVEIEVLITIELVTLVLGFGDQVEVLAPDQLKESVKSALINSLKKYQD